MSNSKPRQLHICFIPMMAPGHMIPMIDIARKLARQGAKTTILTTPLNASQFSQTIETDRKHGSQITISLIKFPAQEAGLPENCENLASTVTSDMSLKFFKALDLLQEPVEVHVQENRPDCIVAGAFFWWANDVAKKLNIPRIIFYGTGYFPMCVYKSLKEHKPHEKVLSDSEEFVVPGLPEMLRMSRRQLPEEIKVEEDKNPLAETVRKIVASELTSFGMIVNSFNELEPDYARHYKEVLGRKAWNIGPVSLFNEDKARRGKLSASSSDDHDDCLSWLNSKKPNSVVYVCFGSMAIFSSAQLLEIAKGLEVSGKDFIWVVREKGFDWLPEGFEERMEGRGLMIKGWAPQVMILDHEAVGGFITHCGWNSLLEGVAAGLPMVTWPLSAEQFFNEKLVVELLKIGIPVGVREWSKRTDERECVTAESIGKVVAELMDHGEVGERMRSRARKLGEMAKRAVENGGSSDTELKCLLEEIRNYVLEKIDS